MEALLSDHWCDDASGTGLTNFGPEQFDLYEKAVAEFGDPDFVVSSLRMSGRGHDMPGGSLHYKGRIRTPEGEKACSGFWKVYDRIRDEMRSTRIRRIGNDGEPMSEQTQQAIGKVLTGSEQRDAIHFAVAPVVASERLSPGQHVALLDGENVGAVGKHIGIIDPFLTAPVFKGERCWLFLYPNTITALRHNWTHPAFTEGAVPAFSASEKWLRDYAEEMGFSYERLLAGGEAWLEDGEGMRYHTDIPNSAYEKAPEFWRHFEAVTGKPVPSNKKEDSIFWCSC